MSGSFLLPAAGWIWAMLARRAGNPLRARWLARRMQAGANPTPAHPLPRQTGFTPGSPLLPLVLSLATLAAHADSLAIFYGQNPPLTDLQAYDHIVVEPAALNRAPAPAGNRWYAYVSVGEVAAQREYRNRMPAHWLAGHNPDWDSEIVDQSQPDWPGFFVEQVVSPLWQRGYRGLFLDTLDSYQRIARTPQAQLAQQQGLIRVIQAIRQRFPEMKLIANRGFELLPAIAGQLEMVVAESLYQSWDASQHIYRSQSAADSDWLREQLRMARQRYGLKAAAIDYVDPAQPELARQTARRILADGFIPWVSTPALDRMGTGDIDIVPRRVLILHDSVSAENFIKSDAIRYLTLPLQHLGLVPAYHDLSLGPPAAVHDSGLAGIVVWSDSGRIAALEPWLARQRQNGTPIALFGSLPATGRKLADWGLQATPTSDSDRGPLTIGTRHPAVGFEAPPLPQEAQLQAVTLSQPGERWLTLQRNGQPLSDAIAMTSWGGYLLPPFGVIELPNDTQRWVTDPFRFLQAALRLPAVPVPDVTTDHGRRTLLVHIDGDGFASRSELPGTPFASEVMRDEILRRYRLPATVSVIEGETGSQGLFGSISPTLENIARQIFAEPYIEPASHSFSHPFKWQQLASDSDSGDGYNLPIRGYRFDLAREVDGSLGYLNQRLLPAGKRAGVFLWTGDCNPGPDALAQADAAGVLAMNGGETVMTRSLPSLTAIAPFGAPKGPHFQVFAPNQNENVYTNNWTGPFYGFDRVIETFELTDRPRRLKPVNIYFHTYAASKLASLRSLHKIFQWALSRPSHPVFASDYIRRIHDFNQIAIRRIDGGWQIRGAQHLRQLRIDDSAGYPDLQRSQGVLGYWQEGTHRYIHLGSSEATLILQPTPPDSPYLAQSNGKLTGWQITPSGIEASLAGQVPLQFVLANLKGCRFVADKRPVRPVRTDGPFTHFKLTAHAIASFRADCQP